MVDAATGDREAAAFWRTALSPQLQYDAAGRPRVLAKHGGWLTVFQAWISLIALAFVWGFVRDVQGPRTFVTAAVVVTWLGVLLGGLVLIAQRAKRTRLYWSVLLLVLAALIQLPGKPNSGDRSLMGLTLWFLGWWLYWQRSYRVLATFSPERVRPSPQFLAARRVSQTEAAPPTSLD
jgi:hypothetical protein